MEMDKRFTSELVRIIGGALRLDIEKVRNYTEFLATKVEESGDTVFAGRLRTLLKDSDRTLRPVNVSFSAPPVDPESRFPLVEKVNLYAPNEPMLILEESQWDVVNEFISVAKSTNLSETDMTDSVSLLIYGPPGTGKSRLARHLAKDLGLDLYVARLDGLISSFLGSTSKNIRAVLEFAAKTPCVLLLDEFDAIAKLRGDAQELGELKRVVSSFIQNLDLLGPGSILVAATNHESLLDPAIWRRFAYRLHMDLPGSASREKMWLDFSVDGDLGPRHGRILADLSDGMTGSEIRTVCTRMKRKFVGSDKRPGIHEYFGSMVSFARDGAGKQGGVLGQILQVPHEDLPQFLRDRDKQLYSLAALGELLGTSKATVHRMTQEGE